MAEPVSKPQPEKPFCRCFMGAPQMTIVDQLAEQRIQEAYAEGAFEDLPGAGKPLPEEDLSMVPAHLRAGYKLLKNAGFVPPELEAAKTLREAEDLLEQITDPGQRQAELKRLRAMETSLRERRGQGLNPQAQLQYQDQLATAFAKQHD